MFIFIADFGHYIYEFDKLLLLSKNIKKHKANFILCGGDNFYPGGIIKSNKNNMEKYFNEIFESYKDKMYAVLGNHDYYGNIYYQINNPAIFNIPHNYYKLEYKQYDIFMIDTQILSPYLDNLSHDVFKNMSDNNYNKDSKSKEKFLKELQYNHLIWLNDELKKTIQNNRIPIVFGHYPLYTEGMYKSYNRNNYLLSCLIPLFVKYNVKLYISGHDHISQHSQLDKNTIFELYKTCSENPIIKQLVPEFNNSIEYYDNYKLNVIVSGASIDLYEKYGNNKIHSITQFYNDKNNMYLKCDLDNDITLSFYENNINNKCVYSFTI